MAVVMIKIVGLDGIVYNINLAQITAVRYVDPADVIPHETIWAMSNRKALRVPPGSFQAAVAALLAEFNTNPKVSEHLFVGTTP